MGRTRTAELPGKKGSKAKSARAASSKLRVRAVGGVSGVAGVGQSKTGKVVSKLARGSKAGNRQLNRSPEATDAQAILEALHTALTNLESPIGPNLVVLMKRMIREVPRLAVSLDDDQALRALSAPTDAGTLARALEAVVVSDDAIRTLDPGAEALVRAAERKRRLLEEAGGVYGTATLTQLLGIKQQSIDKRVQRGALLAMRTPSGDLAFPVLQFTDEGTVDGLEQVLDAFNIESPWTRLSILLSPDEALGGERIIDALRAGRVDEVVEVVQSYGA